MKHLRPIEQEDTLKVASASKSDIMSYGYLRKLKEYLWVVLLPVTFLLWCISLRPVDVHQISDLGMISAFPPSFIIALVILCISFYATMRQTYLRTPILLLHIALLIFMLYGIQNMVEQAPRFSTLYKHAGYTEYIMRTGSVNPSLDAYFSWPGFFILSAFVTQASGYHDILSYAGWAPVFFNIIYAGPLYMIFCSATTNKRVVWLAMWTFYLTNWVAQDYFSPQGLNFFMYLVIIAILLKWFKVSPQSKLNNIGQFKSPSPGFSTIIHKMRRWLVSPDSLVDTIEPGQRAALLLLLIIIFGFIVFSHPLTPFFVLASVGVLVLFRRCRPWWLPVLMAIMTGLWILLMTQTFLAGHMNMVVGNFAQVKGAVSSNVTKRVLQGDIGHTIIATLRVFAAGLLWLLAFVGALLRLRKGYKDISYILLALAPFPLIVAQQYGGEMFLRIYLFSLPFTVFFVVSIFSVPLKIYFHKIPRKVDTAILCLNLLMLLSFFFTRYGNEKMDYMTYAEIAGVQHLYNMAAPGSLLIGGWNDTPWEFQDYEKYHCYTLTDVLPDAVPTQNVNAIIQFIKDQGLPHAYMLFTRSEVATSEIFSGLPAGSLHKLEEALLKSGKFKQMYSNPDVQIFLFTDNIVQEKGAHT